MIRAESFALEVRGVLATLYPKEWIAVRAFGTRVL